MGVWRRKPATLLLQVSERTLNNDVQVFLWPGSAASASLKFSSNLNKNKNLHKAEEERKNNERSGGGTQIRAITLVFCFIGERWFQDGPIFKVLGSYFLSEGLYRITGIRAA